MQPAQHLAGQRLHVAFGAARVRRDEVGDQLVVEPVAAADRAEVVVEPLEKGEGRFAHQREHPLLGVLGSDFEPSRRVMADDRLQVVASVEEVVADAAADEGLLDPLYGADLGVEIEQRPVVVVQVGADARVQTRGAPAAGAERAGAAAHAVHVGRGGADVGEVAPEIGHRRDAAHLVENRPLRPRVDELALMRRNGAEGAAAEAAAVDVDRMLDHLPRRDVALAAVARMRRPFVGKVERPVEFFGRERRVGGVDHHVTVARGFDQYAVRLHEVALRLDAAEIFGEGVRVGRALLVGVQQQPVFEPVDVGAVGEERHLPEFAQQLGVVAVAHRRGYLLHDALAHAVDQQVGTAVDEDRGFERILPVVVVGEPPQRRFDAAHHHRRAGIEPFEDAGVGLDSVVGAEARRTARGVGVVAAQTFVGRIVVDHRVHGPGRHGEEEARRAELAEIAQVVAPVGLRNHRYAVTFCFEQAADDRRAESRMVDVGVAREENDVHRIPAPLAGLFDCGRQKSHRDRLFSFYGFRSASVRCGVSCADFSIFVSTFLIPSIPSLYPRVARFLRRHPDIPRTGAVG